MIVRALTGDHTVQRLSDHATRRQLRRTQLHQDVYRRVSPEHQLGVQLPRVGCSPGRAGSSSGLR
jgi:hypothetical protein